MFHLISNLLCCVFVKCVIMKTEHSKDFWRKPRKLKRHPIPRKNRNFSYFTKLQLYCMCEWGLKCLIIDIIATQKIRFNNCFVWKTQFFKLENFLFRDPDPSRIFHRQRILFTNSTTSEQACFKFCFSCSFFEKYIIKTSVSIIWAVMWWCI